MPQATVTLPNGRTADITFDTADQLNATVNDLVAHAGQPESQPSKPPLIDNPVDTAINNVRGAITEPIMHVGSQIVGSAVGGLRGLANLAMPSNAGHRLDSAVDAINSTQNAFTYQPRTAAGKAVTQAITTPFKLLDQGTNYIGEKTTDAAQALGASPEVAAGVGTAVKTGLDIAIPAKIAKGFKGADIPSPEAAAKDYVTRNLDTPWDALSDKTRQTLTAIAEDSKNLQNLDPKAVERQARLDALNVPATRGQITRDLPQLTREENITKSDAGQPVRDINAAQDTRLHELVDNLRQATGGQAETRQALGTSVQDEALRAKEAASKSNYNRLYAKARAMEPDATVPAQPMQDLLKENPEIQHLGFLKSWLDKANLTSNNAIPKTPDEIKSALDSLSRKAQALPEDMPFDSPEHQAIAKQYASFKAQLDNPGSSAATQSGQLKLSELDDLRKKASGIAKSGGDNGYYAGEVVKAIDKSFEQVPEAAKAWADARDAFKAHKLEFSDTGAVNKLVGNRSRIDRKTALEDTFDTVVLKGSAEDITKVRNSLINGGTPETRAKGIQAWKDIQAATLDYLKEKAAGKRAIVGEKNQLQFNSTFRDAFNELEKDGKIDEIFTPEQAKLLRQINNVVGDVRTKPTGRIAGSDTTPRLLSMLERVSKVPVAGNVLVGMAKGGKMLYDIGKDASAAKNAARSPLDETAAKSQKKTANTAAVKKFTKYAPATQRE